MKELIGKKTTKTEEMIEYPDVPGLLCLRTTTQEQNGTPRVNVCFRLSGNPKVYSRNERICAGYPATPFLCIADTGEAFVVDGDGVFMPHAEYESKYGVKFPLPRDEEEVREELYLEVCKVLDYLAAHGSFCGMYEGNTIISINRHFLRAGCCETWNVLRECNAINSLGEFLPEHDKDLLRRYIGELVYEVESVLGDVSGILKGDQ